MVKIDDLNEPVLLHNLSKRYSQDKIYVSHSTQIYFLAKQQTEIIPSLDSHWNSSGIYESI